MCADTSVWVEMNMGECVRTSTWLYISVLGRTFLVKTAYNFKNILGKILHVYCVLSYYTTYRTAMSNHTNKECLQYYAALQYVIRGRKRARGQLSGHACYKTMLLYTCSSGKKHEYTRGRLNVPACYILKWIYWCANQMLYVTAI